MRTVCPVNPILPFTCEKSTLFRHGILLPKIEYAPIIPSRMGQPIAFPVSVTEILQLKTYITDHDFLFLNIKMWQRRN
jgi:hypothetical protein